MNNIRRHGGFGIVEIMIAVTISSLMTIAVVTVYLTQSATFTKQSSRNSAAEHAWNAYFLIENLFKHAESNGFDVDYGVGDKNAGTPPSIELVDGSGLVVDDEITVTFQIPLGMNIWPNDEPPYKRNQLRLTWKNHGTNNHMITLATSDGVAFDPEIVLAGGDGGGNSRVINFDLWPLDEDGLPLMNANDYPEGGYQMTLSTRAGKATQESDPVLTVSGVVIPRNWL